MSYEALRLSEKDAFAVSEIEKLCFSHPWSEATLISEMKDPLSDFFGVFIEDELAGYIGGRTIAGETEIFNVAVSPKFRRKGLGRVLIKRFIDEARKKDTEQIFLEVRTSNLPAISLYESEGFAFCGIRKDYYTDPKENAILMHLAFDGTMEYEEWDDDE